MTPRNLGTLCLAVSSLTVGAQTIVIDDFAAGQLISSVNTPGQYSFTQTGPEASIIGGTRQLDIDNGSGYTAIVSTSSEVFRFDARGFYSEPPPPQTSYSLTYGSSSAPLSLSLKAADQFQLSVMEAISGGGTAQIQISFQWQIVTDATHISTSPVVFIQDSPANLLVPLGDFQAAVGGGPADFSNINSISLKVVFPDAYSTNPIQPPPASRLRLYGMDILLSVPEPIGAPVWLLSLVGLVAWRSVQQKRSTRSHSA